MDYISYISPATVRSLVVPIQQLEQYDLRKIIDILKRVRDVRTLDLIHNPGKFNPQAYPHGHIYFNFITKDEDDETLFLHDFEPFRKTNIVIGVAKWNVLLNDDSIRKMKTELQKRYPSPISQFILIFECPKDYETKVSEVYTIDESTLNMETKLCDLTSRFLSNFSTYASAYEHTTLRSPGNMTRSISNLRKKHTASFELNAEKMKLLGSKGRKLKLSANFYLIAGNLKNALNEFSEAIYNLNFASDYLWLASALDGLGVCLFLLTSIGVPYQLPAFLENLIASTDDLKSGATPLASPRSSFQIPRTSSSFSRSIDSLSTVAPKVVENTILRCGKLSAIFYEKAINGGTEQVPQIVFSECLIRYCLFEVSINANQKFDSELIKQILNPIGFNKLHLAENFKSEAFHSLCYFILNTKFKQLSDCQQMKIYHSLACLYFKTNMKMKYCLLVSCFLDSIIGSDKIVYGSKIEYDYLDNLLEEYCTINNIMKKNTGPNHVQVRKLNQVLKFCEKISYYKAYIHYGFIGLDNFRNLLTNDEQIEIHKNVQAFSLMVTELPEYWDSRIFVDFQYEVESEKIVEGETCTVSVLLRNPYAFEIEIKDLKLSTLDNFPLKVSAYDFSETENFNTFISNILKPYSELVISLDIIPERPGKLEIDGVIAAVDICKTKKFAVYREQPNSFLPKVNKNPLELPLREAKTWAISVVHTQPLLKIVTIGLSDKWLMLLEGERRRFKVELKNISKTEINHLISKFKDSTTELLTAELNNKSLQPSEIYEIEYQLLKRKPFKILNKDQLSNIKGYQPFHLDVEIMGKLGVKEASLFLEYSYQKDASIEFQRNLTIPVNLTVYPSVELAGCDIIPLTSNTKFNEINSDICWKYLGELKQKGANLTQFCLLALDFVNMWSEQMEIIIDGKEFIHLNEEMLPEFKSTCLIHSRKNARVFIPILRMDLDDDYLNQRIPSLRNRQFVIDTKTPAAEQLFIKNSFWYKEEILKRVKATWKVSSATEDSIHSGKIGEIDMRGFRFSSKMIQALEIEKVGIKLELLDVNGKAVDLGNVLLHTFYAVRIELKNRNKAPIFGMLRHIPVCKDPPYVYDRKILINGALQFSIESQLKPGETRLFELGVTFMEKGEYEWGAIFDEMSGWDDGNISIKKNHLQKEQLKFTIL